MNAVSIPAHFDGEHIQLDEPYTLADAKLLVTILPGKEEEREAWLRLSVQRLQDACNSDEPEYPVLSIREINPNYDRDDYERAERLLIQYEALTAPLLVATHQKPKRTRTRKQG